MAVVPTLERRGTNRRSDPVAPSAARTNRLAMPGIVTRLARTGAPASGEHDRAERLLRWATSGVIGFHVLLAVVEVTRPWAWPAPPPNGYGRVFVASLLITVCWLPLHLRHVLHFLRGTRPASDLWTLAMMVALYALAVPVVKVGWAFMFASLITSVLFVVRPPWSVAIAVVLLAAPFGVALVNDWPAGFGVYFSAAVLWRSKTLFVITWTVAAARQLHAARRELADDAVVSERVRIERELRESVGARLDELTTQGRHASELAEQGDRTATAAALQEVVHTSRHTLALTRTIISGYRAVSFADELVASVTLLRAAGFDTALLGEPDGIGEDGHDDARSEFRQRLASLLRRDPADCGRVEVDCRGSRLEVRTNVAVSASGALHR